MKCYKFGEKVRIINDGKCYPQWEELAKILELDKWKKYECKESTNEWRILGKSLHPDIPNYIVYGIENDNCDQILIGEEGIEKINKNKYITVKNGWSGKLVGECSNDGVTWYDCTVYSNEDKNGGYLCERLVYVIDHYKQEQKRYNYFRCKLDDKMFTSGNNLKVIFKPEGKVYTINYISILGNFINVTFSYGPNFRETKALSTKHLSFDNFEYLTGE